MTEYLSAIIATLGIISLVAPLFYYVYQFEKEYAKCEKLLAENREIIEKMMKKKHSNA
jgi:hypothetical protein